MKTQVAMVKCPDYMSPHLGESIEKCLSFLGGFDTFFKPRRKIFVKINHLSPGSPPERAIVTHPSFVRETLRFLKDLDMDILVGDDIQSGEMDGFLISGYQDMCRSMGVRLVNLKSKGFRRIACPDGEILKEALISNTALDSDYVLNVPKLKTHVLTAFTGGVKNLYGLVPLGLRLDYHNRFPRNDAFSRLLVDILSCAPPQLTLMDGILAMEGQGPSGGKPRALGVVLAGRDAVAVDAVASAIIGFSPGDVLSTQYAGERGLGSARLEDITILGEKLDQVRALDFSIPVRALSFMRKKLPSAIYGYLSGQLILVPEVAPEMCTGCGECLKICPKKAVRMDGAKAFISKPECLSCLCCYEVCRFNALKLRRRPMGRVVRFFEKLPRWIAAFRRQLKMNEKKTPL